MIRANEHQKPFVKLYNEEHLQDWYLGYSTHFECYVGWSDLDGPGRYKRMDTIEELRNLCKWFIGKEYKVLKVYQDNIDNHRQVR